MGNTFNRTKIEFEREAWNEHHRKRSERVRAFEEAVRNLAFDHGFEVTRVQVDNQQSEMFVGVSIDFTMDNRIPPKDRAVTGDTIRLEEGRHEAL